MTALSLAMVNLKPQTESVAWIVFLNGLVQRGRCLDTKNAKFVLSLPRNAHAKDYSILDD